MKNILIGNGINIQFGGNEYSNKSIIQRAISNVANNNFASVAYPYEILEWFYTIFNSNKDIIKGKFDKYAVFDKEKEDLKIYKSHYSKKSKIYEIGFEDYFLVQSLFYRKNKHRELSIYELNTFLKRFFLESIYNQGKINLIHEKFPKLFIEFIKQFDTVLTTNYDQNIELSTKLDVNYIHGAFHFLDDVYSKDSLRNKLRDRPFDKQPNISGTEYLYSNAISDSSSSGKEFSATMSSHANQAIEKILKGYKTNPELKTQIEEWKNSKDSFGRKMYETIKLKLKNPKLKYSEDIKLNLLSNIKGDITIIGLSPYNDSHIFKRLDENSDINTIEYYFFNEIEGITINEIFKNKEIICNDIKEFWKNM